MGWRPCACVSPTWIPTPSPDPALGPQHWGCPVEPGPPWPPWGPAVCQPANCRPPLSLLLLGPARARGCQPDGRVGRVQGTPAPGAMAGGQASVLPSLRHLGADRVSQMEGTGVGVSPGETPGPVGPSLRLPWGEGRVDAHSHREEAWEASGWGRGRRSCRAGVDVGWDPGSTWEKQIQTWFIWSVLPGRGAYPATEWGTCFLRPRRRWQWPWPPHACCWSRCRNAETPGTACTCSTPPCPAFCWSWPTSPPTSSPSKVSLASVWAGGPSRRESPLGGSKRPGGHVPHSGPV